MTDQPSPPAPWLLLRNISFSHGPQRVLRDIELEFHPGKHYILAGPNGAGKTTLLDILARLRRPDSGSLALMGSDAARYGPGEFARLLALAPQEFPLDFSFSVREVVAMGRRPHLGRWGRMNAADEEAVDRAVGALRLSAIAGKPVTALSGGERRRCVVARAVAQDAPILLLDEPNAGLDIAQALSVMALARRLAEGGRLVITVSHDLNLAAVYGHEIVFLKGGRVAAAGPVSETFTDAVLSTVYETGARVRRDDFSGGPSVSFREPS